MAGRTNRLEKGIRFCKFVLALFLNRPRLVEDPERFHRTGNNPDRSFSLLAQRKRTKRKGALSLGPSDFSALLKRSGTRGNSLRCWTSRQWGLKKDLRRSLVSTYSLGELSESACFAGEDSLPCALFTCHWLLLRRTSDLWPGGRTSHTIQEKNH
jgi:hypothetical protein